MAAMASRVISAQPLLVFVSLGCVPRGRVPVLPAGIPSLAASFSPGLSDPARKARLLALAPRLDAYFASKLEQARATGLAVGIVLEGELVYGRGIGVRDV